MKILKVILIGSLSFLSLNAEDIDLMKQDENMNIVDMNNKVHVNQEELEKQKKKEAREAYEKEVDRIAKEKEDTYERLKRESKEWASSVGDYSSEKYEEAKKYAEKKYKEAHIEEKSKSLWQDFKEWADPEKKNINKDSSTIEKKEKK